MPAGIVRTEADPVTVHGADDVTAQFTSRGITARCLVGTDGRAEAMTQHMLTFPAGTYELPSSARHDHLVYVMSGTGQVAARGRTASLTPGTSTLIPAGELWTVSADAQGVHASCIRLPTPALPAAAGQWQEPGEWTLTNHVGEQARQAATSDRQFEVLYDSANGCGGATQFLGFIPQTGAPEHYHLYDEICTVVRGAGRLLVGDTVQDLTVGSTFHVPPRFLHAVHNSGTEDLHMLGVFRPAGSAAAAYYPDGRAAFSG
ncbi:MAG: cupin domain-containing protein [Nakamurella sp.]